jgi:hypothetical protein
MIFGIPSDQSMSSSAVGLPSWAQEQAQNQLNQTARALQYVKGRFHVREPMTASDLGIVDQLLDDKVGMEP